MLIKYLKDKYPLVYEAVLDNQAAQGKWGNDSLCLNEGKSKGNFDWEESPEGYDFWKYINRENFEEAKKLCPHLFEEQIDMKATNLLDCHGKRFKAKIEDIECEGIECEGIITVENGDVYLCQDVIGGKGCKNKQGYKYSWCIGKGNNRDLIKNAITSFQLINNPISTTVTIDENAIMGGMDLALKSDTTSVIHSPESTHPLLSKPTNKRQLLTIK